jgi:hypothetical protein
VLARLSAPGRRVVVLAVPCYPDQGRGPGSTIRGDERRVRGWNDVARTVAPGAGAEVLAYDELFCGVPTAEQPEREDGVHLTVTGAEDVWRWLAPQLGIGLEDEG